MDIHPEFGALKPQTVLAWAFAGVALVAGFYIGGIQKRNRDFGKRIEKYCGFVYTPSEKKNREEFIRYVDGDRKYDKIVIKTDDKVVEICKEVGGVESKLDKMVLEEGDKVGIDVQSDRIIVATNPYMDWMKERWIVYTLFNDGEGNFKKSKGNCTERGILKLDYKESDYR
jgi:hypothetical protein